MDKTNQAISSEADSSNNMAGSSTSKKERWVAHISMNKFHTEPMTKPESRVKLNPVMRDLVINEHMDEIHKKVAKKKWRKWKKIETIAKTTESVGENQPVWLDTLKEEITRMK
jgi:hypothetical protein